MIFYALSEKYCSTFFAQRQHKFPQNFSLSCGDMLHITVCIIASFASFLLFGFPGFLPGNKSREPGQGKNTENFSFVFRQNVSCFFVFLELTFTSSVLKDLHNQICNNLLHRVIHIFHMVFNSQFFFWFQCFSSFLPFFYNPCNRILHSLKKSQKLNIKSLQFQPILLYCQKHGFLHLFSVKIFSHVQKFKSPLPRRHFLHASMHPPIQIYNRRPLSRSLV